MASVGFKKPSGRRRAKSGFSIIEMTFAMAITAIMAACLSSVFMTILESHRTQLQMTMAENVGMSFSDQFRIDSRVAKSVRINGVAPTTSGTPVSGDTLTMVLRDDSTVTYNIVQGGGMTRTLNRKNGQQLVYAYVDRTFASDNGRFDDSRMLAVRCTRLNDYTAQGEPCFSAKFNRMGPSSSTLQVSSGLIRITIDNPKRDPACKTANCVRVEEFGEPGFNVPSLAFEITGSKFFR